MVEHTTREVTDADAQAIVDIFNYHAQNSFAAYADHEVGIELFHRLRNASRKFLFLVVEVEHKVVGFGLMCPYHTFETFKKTAVLTYFLLPDYTRLGLGSELLNRLVRDARARGVDNLLAHISSRNKQSLDFHRKHGFVECGRLRGIGVKFGEEFDVVWVQKSL